MPVQLFVFKNSICHSKTTIIDDELKTVKMFNIKNNEIRNKKTSRLQLKLDLSKLKLEHLNSEEYSMIRKLIK